MENNTSGFFILVLFLTTFTTGFSQFENLTIKQEAEVDLLLQKKIALDKERFETSYYTLQLYYGNPTTANEILEQSQLKFPHIPVELSFETPNYKVQAGKFKDKLIGLKTLDTVKRTFPSAFLLNRKQSE